MSGTIFFYLFWLLVACAVATTTTTTTSKAPNIVFLVCESTDGRTWREGYQNNVIPLPHLRQLEAQPGGYSFHRHYSNSPVCCPSRATFWSGRHAHKIPHVQRQQCRSDKKKIRELAVNGVWNNFEGLPRDFEDRMDQILESNTVANYTTYLSGKRDWVTGGHTINVRLSSWTMYARFPYNIPKEGGWADELPYVCGMNGTVRGPNTNPHWDDWKTLNKTIDWIKDYKAGQENGTIDKDKPFFVYQGMNIVHPPYLTNQYWYDKIDPDKITVPEWIPLDQMHPCDLQSSMLKGCIPPMDNATAHHNYYDYYRRRNIRRIYYAMIAEFDSMVGAYMTAIQDVNESENTIFVVTSDHGDLQMEHQQSYKMVPYDASSSVPLVIMDGRVKASDNNEVNDRQNNNRVVHMPTQLIDIYPTLMDMVGVPHTDYPYDKLDGHSLVPLMKDSQDLGNSPTKKVPDETELADRRNLAVNTTQHPDFVVSQFHGMNIAMSWFLIVKVRPCLAETTQRHHGDNKDDANGQCAYKLVVWGTGHEVDSQLFDLTHDPDEMMNRIHDVPFQSLVSELEHDLRSVVEYQRVALDVAAYNKISMKNWMEVTGDPEWREEIHKSNLYWDATWEHDSAGAFRAVEEWVNSTKVQVLPCRSDLVWPPSSRPSSGVSDVAEVENS